MAKQARIVDFQEARSSSRSRSQKQKDGASSRARSAGNSQGFKQKTRTKSQPLDNKAPTSSKAASQRSNKASASKTSSRASGSSQAKRTSASKVEQAKRSRAKKKAEKAFQRSVAQQPASEEGPRAALYKGKMGSSHKKATKMQADTAGVKLHLPHISIGRGKLTALLVCACVVVGCALLYVPVKNYYWAVRDQAKAEVAYELVATRNEALVEDVALLSSQEGMEDRVRQQYGWVKEGENAVNVAGLTESGEPSAAEILRTITLNDIKAPETWYSPLLDSVFGYEN